MRYHLLTIVSALFLLSPTLAGKDKKFNSYNLEDGLSSSTVTCFYKSKNNLVWLGTSRGIDLFTGKEFIPLQQFVTDSTSSISGIITAINELRDNTIWAGTWGDGIFSVNIETGEYKHYKSLEASNDSTISDDYINCIEVYDNNLWIGTNFCLNQTDGKGRFMQYSFKEVLTKGSADIRAIIPRYDYLLTIFTDEGEIVELNSQTGAYRKIGEINEPIKNITKVTVDPLGNYWIGTSYQGLKLLDKEFNQLPLPSNLSKVLGNSNVSDILCEPEYGMFVSSDGEGLFIIDPTSYSYQLIKESNSGNSLSSNQVESLFIDADDILWVGYYKDGFSNTVYKDDGIRHIHMNEHNQLLPDKNVNGFTEDYAGNIWIGTENGITIVDSVFTEFKLKPIHRKAIEQLKLFPITSLSCNKDGTIIYAGTFNHGLFCINLLTNRINNYNLYNSALESNFIRDVKSYNDTINYVASVDGGIYRFDGKRFEKIKVLYQNNYELLDFLNIEFIDSTNLWLSSTGKGIIKVNTATGSGELFNSVIATICYSSCLTKDSVLFLATNKGIFEYSSAENDFTLINSTLLNVDFYGIIEEGEHHLWISSSDGLFLYDRQQKRLEKINSINIQGKEFLPGAYHTLSNGNKLFGGTNGFNIIKPKNFVLHTNNSSLFISEFKIYNKPIKPGDTYAENHQLVQHINYNPQVTIPYDIDLFSINVKSINYLTGNGNKIAYTIEHDKKLSNVFYSDGEIAFLNLEPGLYKLNIYPLCNGNKEILPAAAKHLIILKQTPWWQKTWIYAALFVLIIGTILTLHQLRIREYRKTQKLLQEKVTERTATLLSQKERLQQQKNELQEILAKNQKLESFKESIINMIIHDLKNPLNGIIGLSSLNEAEYLEHINSASRQMLCLVENILDVRRYETHSLQLFYQQCDIRQLVNEAIEEVRFLLKDNQIEIINLTHSIIVQVDKDILRRVYINLLTNAIKYSQLNGKITIKGEPHNGASEKSLLLSVQDEGRGIPKQYQDSVFDLYQQIDTKKSGLANSNGLGLSFCKIAINEHKGKIWVDSDVDMGATFYIIIPMQKPKS